MPQLRDMMSQMQRGQNPMQQTNQMPSTLQPMAAEPMARGMSAIARSVQSAMQPQGAPAGV